MNRETKPSFTFGLLLFPNMTQLDLTGPYEVFARVPGAHVHLIWKTLDPVTTEKGMTILPTTTFATCPPLDLICVPGGPGQIELMEDMEVIDFLRKAAETCRFITSVCTGSLVLAAAGLLRGYRATTHWASRDQLALLGVETSDARVVFDRNRITGAGVTSGIDFALSVVWHVMGEEMVKQIQLQMEYDPDPPFDAGTPSGAGPEITALVTAKLADFLARRREATVRAASALKARGPWW